MRTKLKKCADANPHNANWTGLAKLKRLTWLPFVLIAAFLNRLMKPLVSRSAANAGWRGTVVINAKRGIGKSSTSAIAYLVAAKDDRAG